MTVTCQNNPLQAFAKYNGEDVYRARHRVSKNREGARSLDAQFVESASYRPPHAQYPRTVAVLRGDTGVASTGGGAAWVRDFQQLNLQGSSRESERASRATRTRVVGSVGAVGAIGLPPAAATMPSFNSDSLFKFQDHPVIERMSQKDLEAFYEKEFVDIDNEFGANWTDEGEEGDDNDQVQVPVSKEGQDAGENKTYEHYNEFSFNEQQTFQNTARDILKNVSETQHEYTGELNNRLSGSQFVKLLKNIEIGNVTLKPDNEKPHELIDKDNKHTYGHHYVEVPDDTTSNQHL